MDVLDGSHQQSGETHRDGGGMGGWRAVSRKKEKKKSTALKFIAAQQREIEWLGENGGQDTADNHFRCLAASTTARHSISLGMMLRYSDRVAAPLLLCSCTCGTKKPPAGNTTQKWFHKWQHGVVFPPGGQIFFYWWRDLEQKKTPKKQNNTSSIFHSAPSWPNVHWNSVFQLFFEPRHNFYIDTNSMALHQLKILGNETFKPNHDNIVSAFISTQCENWETCLDACKADILREK